MGFFKKLKERLFKLNIDEKPQKKAKETKAQVFETNQVDIEDFDFSVSHDQLKPQSTKAIRRQTVSITPGDFDSDKTKQQSKLAQKQALERQKQRQKEKRINKYVAGMHKPGNSFALRLKELQARHSELDEDFFEDLEELLILSDVGIKMVDDIVDEIKKTVRIENINSPKLIGEIIADKMFVIYANQSHITTTFNIKDNRLNVILMTGVNGVGKTTTIAKLVNIFQKQNKKVLIAAADTFRAGAVSQLEVWANRLNCPIVKPQHQNADPASVVYDGIQKAKTEKVDILIIDTAGRLQNKVNLMNELAKIKRIIEREVPGGPHETALVIDATTGQNGVLQAQQFKEITNVTGIILTKMDGTSKGGIILAIKEKLDLPVKYVGLGEKIEDLEEFDLDLFIYGLTKDLIDATEAT